MPAKYKYVVLKNNKYKHPKSTIALIKANPSYIKDVDQTPELRKAALEKDGNVLIYIDNPTREEIILALSKNPECILKMKDLNIEFKKFAVNREPALILYIDELLSDKEELIRATVANPVILQEDEINKNLTQEIANEIIEKNKSAIHYLNWGFQSREICIKCLREDGMLLEAISKEYQNIEYIKCALNQNPDAAIYVKIWDYEIANIVIDFNPLALEYVPRNLLTYELIKRAVMKNGLALESVAMFVTDYTPPDEVEEMLNANESAHLNIIQTKDKFIKNEQILNDFTKSNIISKNYKSNITKEVYVAK